MIMNWARRLTPMLVLLGSGCEFVKDTGVACLVPKQLACECFDSEEFPCEPSWVPWENGWLSCTGSYPADVAYTVEAELYEGGLGYGIKEKCKLKLDGNRIQFSGQFWHEPERDAIVEPAVIVSCDTPPLSAGTYTLEYGDAEVEVEIGGDALQEMACVESREQHSPER